MVGNDEIPEAQWDAVFNEAVLDVWDQDEAPGDMVQPGVWNGRGIEIVYRLPEDFEDRMNEAEAAGRGDEYLRTLVESVRFEEE